MKRHDGPVGAWLGDEGSLSPRCWSAAFGLGLLGGLPGPKADAGFRRRLERHVGEARVLDRRVDRGGRRMGASRFAVRLLERRASG